jgi:transposase
MTDSKPRANHNEKQTAPETPPVQDLMPNIIAPLPNYTLSTVCPACETETFRLACKVRCPRCGFMWDCSEL